MQLWETGSWGRDGMEGAGGWGQGEGQGLGKRKDRQAGHGQATWKKAAVPATVYVSG